HSTTTAHFLGQILPRDACLENKNDPRKNLTAIQRFAPRKAKSSRFLRLQGWFQPLPQGIAYQRLRHDTDSGSLLRTRTNCHDLPAARVPNRPQNSSLI